MTAGTTLQPPVAEAHGRGGRRAVYVGGYYGGFYGFAPWLGWSPFYFGAWGPYPPAFYQPEGGVSMTVAMMTGFGAVDLDIKPNRADVWVDGRYVGEARDLDGYPSYLWLPEGQHRVAVYKGGFIAFEETVSVQRGMKTHVKLSLQPGESSPPGPKPGEEPPPEKRER
jgi:hypothetical protein